MGDIINMILCGHSLEVLREIPAESVHMIMTSPPYWGKRSYKTTPRIWDGDPECEHDFNIKTETGDIRYRGVESSKVTFHKDFTAIEGDGRGYSCSICGAWKGELGHEPTPELYIKHLCDIFDEGKRVLKPYGSCYVNLGDTYAATRSYQVDGSKQTPGSQPEMRSSVKDIGILPKSQCCIPERFKIEMINRNWIARNTIIWYKPNATPESATDRFTNNYEYLYFFTKNSNPLYWTNEKNMSLVQQQPKISAEGIDWDWQPCKKCAGIGCQKCSGMGKVKHTLWAGHDYYFEQQFEPYKQNRWGGKFKNNENVKTSPKEKQCGGQGSLNRKGYDCYPNPLGRNMRSVWKIKVSNFKGAHFAVYPEELCTRPILAGCPEFVCKNCGMPRVKILKPTGNTIGNSGYGSKTADHIRCSQTSSLLTKQVQEKALVGYSECECINPEYEPGIVLDMFSGSGTTVSVALKLGRRGIGIDMNPEYVKMGTARIKPILEQTKIEAFT
ncbi:MAG: site-specific DNA-methyltransferase [Desulfocapsaceae bacterium]|nr:site-specific DNA-methyltransferase [Desulfocapsaceae bacterium]